MRGREAFALLRAAGARVQSGPLWLRYVPEENHTDVRLAFAIPRRVGSAVTRNTVRRRLRAIVQELATAAPPSLPPGLYLVGVRPGQADFSYATLRAELLTCTAGLRPS